MGLAAASYEGTRNVHSETASERGGGSDSRDVTLVTLHHRYLRAEGAARVSAEAALVGEIEAGVWGCCLGLLFGLLCGVAVWGLGG